jgi:hypothetical protein
MSYFLDYTNYLNAALPVLFIAIFIFMWHFTDFLVDRFILSRKKDLSGVDDILKKLSNK